MLIPFKSDAPVARIQGEHFSERQMHGTRAVMVDFTETVHWLQECAVSVELWHRDILLLSVAQYVDHAEYLSCVGRALRSLDAYCQTYRIDRSTELELRATGLITQVPVLAQPSEVRAGGARRNYAYIPSHWLAKPAGTLEPVEIARSVLWTNLRDEDYSEKAVGYFMHKHRLETVGAGL